MKKCLFILAALLLLSSCQGGEGTQTPVTDTASGTVTAVDTAEKTPLEMLPDNLDFGGYEFHILYTDVLDLQYEMYISMEEENGDLMNDAAYKRNRFVEERYNVELVFCPHPVSKTDTIVPTVSQSVMAGDDAYQYLQFSSSWDSMPALISENALLNLLDFKELNLDSEGFMKEANDSMIINDQLYFGFSHYNNAGNLPMYMVFNKDIMRNNGLDIPYDIIFDGGWTMEVFQQYIRGINQDLDGDGKVKGKDQIGFASGDKISNYMVFGYDISLLKRDEDGIYRPDLQNEHFVNAVQKFLDFKKNNPDVYIPSAVDGGTGLTHMFLYGNSMFAHTGAGIYGYSLRAIEDFDFGIAPFPKYDETQEGYGSYWEMAQFGIPVTITEREIVGAVAEGLAVASKEIMTPAFMDMYLESRMVRDEESIRIFQMMREDMVLDISRYYDFSDGEIWPVFMLSKIKDTTKVVSTLEEVEKKAEAQAEEFFSIFFD